MSLNRYDFEKLLDDIKLISKSIKIVRDENNPTNREFACGLTQDLVDRLYRDMEEMKDVQEKNGKTYGGHLKNGEITEK